MTLTSGVEPKTGVAIQAVGEMGGSILTGADSNPLCVLARQLDITWWGNTRQVAARHRWKDDEWADGDHSLV